MRFAIIIAPLFSVLLFSWTAKAQPLAITNLLNDSDKVASCQTDDDKISAVNFYVHKVNPLIVAELSINSQEHFYSLNMEEKKDLVTLSTDKEIVALDYDLYFKITNNIFSVDFTQNTVRDPEAKNFASHLEFKNGKSVNITCQRTAP